MTVVISMTRCSFEVPLTLRQWTELNRTNRCALEVYSVVSGHEHQKIKALMEAGCYDLEWNGHFGRNLFFSCNAEDQQRAEVAVRAFVEGLSR